MATTYKEFKEKLEPKHQFPTLETTFGEHSKKQNYPTLETHFGQHSREENEPKELKEAWEPQLEHPAWRANVRSDDQQNAIHKKVAPLDKKSLSTGEQKSLKEYTSGSKELNASLYKHHKSGTKVSKFHSDDIKNIDTVLSKHRTKEDTHVYTGLKMNPAAGFKSHLKPQIFHMPHNVSTSTDIETAENFAHIGKHKNDQLHGIDTTSKNAVHILKLHIPKGTHAASVKNVSVHDEKEVLLARGHNIKIQSRPEYIGGNRYLWHGTIHSHTPEDIHFK